MLSFVGLMDQGLLLGQALKWLPTWLTPLWLMGVGLGIGAIVSAVVFGSLALLSFVPGIGNLADSPKRGIT
ncbi:MAG: ABC transporter permease, partial [Rubripirellula sp.]